MKPTCTACESCSKAAQAEGIAKEGVPERGMEDHFDSKVTKSTVGYDAVDFLGEEGTKSSSYSSSVICRYKRSLFK